MKYEFVLTGPNNILQNMAHYYVHYYIIDFIKSVVPRHMYCMILAKSEQRKTDLCKMK